MMKHTRKSLALFFLGIFILQFVYLPEYFNFQQGLTKNGNYLDQSIETPYNQYIPSYDNQSHRYIFLFNSSINLIDNATLFSFFSSTLGGVLTSGPWEYLNGFSGIINNSEENLGAFIDQYNPKTFQDNVIEAQMNSIHEQINTYPAVIDSSGYGYLGDLNSTIAFLDSGIDDSHSLINQSNIVAWENYINGSQEYDDINGHGTAITSISLGGGDTSLEPTHTGSTYYITVGGNYSHGELFYPHHITPGWYKFKLASFDLDSDALDWIDIKGKINETYRFDNFHSELYRDGELINSSDDQILDLSWNSTEIINKTGKYDVFFTYNIPFGVNPEFNMFLNITFSPKNESRPFANFTGIAPNTKIASLKILNETGLGYSSNLISALEWIINNGSKLHVVATVLSLANFNMDNNLAKNISSLIDKIINNGTMVIIAAGNMGISTEINKIAMNKKAIIMGAVNNQDQLTYYSNQGNLLEDDQTIAPDLLAPGGSLLTENNMVITADTNDYDPFYGDSELIDNDLTCITGTSVSVAIVAGVYNLVVEALGGWDNLDKSSGKDALFIKSLLLLTATETNMQREDNPNTPYDESLNSPILNRGGSDIHEGYGRINPKAVFDLLNNTFEINSSIEIPLIASTENSIGEHVYATNITLEKNEMYLFNMTFNETFFSTFDTDLYLYASEPDENGEPILVASNPQIGYFDENFYYTNLNETQSFYLVAKAINGQGNITLNVSKQKITQPPNLLNASISPNSNFDFNDTLDIFTFSINYSHPENMPASFINLHTNATSENITLTPDFFDSNFTDGCIYSGEYKFKLSGIYSLNFTVQTGNFYFDYIDPIVNSTIISSIKNLVEWSSTGINSSFSNSNERDLWEFSPEMMNFTYQNDEIEVFSGWDWIEVPYTLEDRRTLEIDENSYSMYCGITGKTGDQHHLLETDGKPFYSYYNITGTYNLISPYIYLNESIAINPIIKLGIRIGINEGDNVQIQVNANRSNQWETLETFSNTQNEWFLVEYNLSEYIQSYTRIRIQVDFDDLPEDYYGGIMVDYVSFEEADNTNNFAPVLSQYHHLSDPEEIQPYYSSSNTEMEPFTFKVAYTDEDGNMPNNVYLEIGDKNYSMINQYGRWNPKKDSNEDYSKEIIFTYTLPILDIVNRSFRFNTFDGTFYNSTPWQPLFNFTSGTTLEFPLTRNLSINEMLILESSATLRSPTLWIPSSDSSFMWHQVSNLGIVEEGEFYCGIGDYQGYGMNLNSSMITPVIFLNETRNIYLNFTHRLRFDIDGEEEGDFGQIFISTNLGDSWELLEKFEQETEGTYPKSISIDISDYRGENVIFKFNFISDDVGIQLKNSGWIISSLTVDIDHSRDYTKPVIEFQNLRNNDVVKGKFNITIKISDNEEIDWIRVDLWINDIQVEYSIENDTIIYFLDTTNYKNGDIIKIVCSAKDIWGNGNMEEILVSVDKSLSIPLLIFLYALGAAIIVSAISLSIREMKIRKLLATGDYIREPSIFARLTQQKVHESTLLQEARLIVKETDKEWEKQQPIKLYCKKCKKLFISEECEIYCPNCNTDTLYVARQCYVCKKWSYFDGDDINHKCKKCDVIILKDFDEAKKQIKLQHEKSKEIQLATEEEKDDFFKAAIKIPNSELKELIKELIDEDEPEI
ncbi:S8 family serine peptidase [Promethearchaeum syntrophicum]|uniref:S8 family serine peptidase n=1 Tax=Promethearchaeum syntrophicum TaxID=2594042 RepID=A0A5B9D9Y0_9ARCH|nr:S8 family serine peptidase [Candidatus Prometheoarchaeum syntrophicum]QEE15903.1 Subtilase family protein [Candidatus Prometheoarchaeum syntrophicum]